MGTRKPFAKPDSKTAASLHRPQRRSDPERARGSLETSPNILGPLSAPRVPLGPSGPASGKPGVFSGAGFLSLHRRGELSRAASRSAYRAHQASPTAKSYSGSRNGMTALYGASTAALGPIAIVLPSAKPSDVPNSTAGPGGTKRQPGMTRLDSPTLNRAVIRCAPISCTIGLNISSKSVLRAPRRSPPPRREQDDGG